MQITIYDEDQIVGVVIVGIWTALDSEVQKMIARAEPAAVKITGSEPNIRFTDGDSVYGYFGRFQTWAVREKDESWTCIKRLPDEIRQLGDDLVRSLYEIPI